MTIGVYKTNINSQEVACDLANDLKSKFAFTSVSFDLEDCDKVLRVMGLEVNTGSIIAFMNKKGYSCTSLD